MPDLNLGKINVGGTTCISYGDQSPAVDAIPLAWQQGDRRIYVGSNPSILSYVCTVAGTPGTWTTVTTGGSSAPLTWFDQEIATAVSLLGLTDPALVAVRQSGQSQNPWFDGNFTTSGGAIAVANVPGGGLKLSGNAGGSVAVVFANNGNSAFGIHDNAAAQMFCAFRFQVNYVADAGPNLGMGFNNTGADGLYVGIRGATSTTNYSIFRDNGSGNSADTGVPIDGAVHTGRLYSLGDGNIYGSIDGAAPVSFATAYNDKTAPALFLFNNGGAVTEEIIITSMLYVAPG